MRTRLLLLGGFVALVAAVAVSETRSTPPPATVATIHVATATLPVVVTPAIEVSADLSAPAPRSENLRSSEQVPEVRPTVGAQRATHRRLTLTHLDYRPARYAGTMEGWGFL